jgi:hypothetical protein
MMRLGSGWFLAAIMLVISPAVSADVIFTDSTFDLSNYSLSPEFNSGTTTTFEQCVSCGNPGTALRVDSSSATGNGVYARAFINDTFAYDPGTQGAITSIDVSIDKNLGNNFAITAGGNTFRPTIQQGGNFYLATILGPPITTGSGGGETGYNTILQTALSATNFQRYDFSIGSFVAGTPDFTGGPLLLGLTQITTFAFPITPPALLFLRSMTIWI